MPNGRRLEAHSGLGNLMDDPSYINAKGRGPTPPNVYDLALREEPFHGVRAIRLNPVDESKMFSRDGILAHTYMLGPNGQSNGCVSFSNYNAFLTAYLNGEVTRLVVVEHLADPPGPQPAAQWFADTIKDYSIGPDLWALVGLSRLWYAFRLSVLRYGFDGAHDFLLITDAPAISQSMKTPQVVPTRAAACRREVRSRPGELHVPNH
jgi:hypothetical protein